MMNNIRDKVMKGGLAAGILAAYLAVSSPTPAFAQGKIIRAGTEVAQDNKAGLVVSSNKNVRLATFSLDLLAQSPDFEDAYLQEVKSGDDLFYRLVIPMPSEKWADVYRKKLMQLNRFGNLSDSYVVEAISSAEEKPVPVPEAVPRSQSPATNSRPVPASQQYSARPTAAARPQVRNLSRSELHSANYNMSRQDFINTFQSEFKSRYKTYYKQDMADETANRRLGNIYDFSNEMRVPPMISLAVVFKESNGSGYVVGDENLGDGETAHGMFQIRKPTIDTVIKMMKARKYAGVPINRTAALANEEHLTRLGIAHLGFCIEKNKDLNLGIRCHNTGLGSKGKNINPYVAKVQEYVGDLTNIVQKYQNEHN